MIVYIDVLRLWRKTKKKRRKQMGSAEVNRMYSMIRTNKAKHPQLREGQLWFNAVACIWPDIAERVRGTDIDPFYDDEKLEAFKSYLFDIVVSF
jgi:hypothetical protein